MEAVDSDTTQEREDAIGQLFAAIAAIHRQLLELIRRHGLSDVWKDDGAQSPADWLQTRFGLDRRNAVEHVRVAESLVELPRIASVFEDGRMSWDQLRQVTRFATPNDDEELSELAPGLSPSQLQRMANRARVVTADREQQDHHKRYVRYRWHETDRSLMISGRIPGADGATVWKALHRIATDSEVDPETGEYEHYQARCADALVRIASHSIAADADVDRATIVVHTDAKTMLDGRGPIEIEAGPTVSHSVLRRLACDSRLELVMDGPGGQPIGIGRRSRTVPGWLKRQLNHRDRGCRFPGCGRIRWTQAHHIIHWADGGRTDLDNLITLCGFHHRFLHDRGWSIEWIGDDIVWKKPDGTIYRPTPGRLREDVRMRIVEPVLVAAGAGPP